VLYWAPAGAAKAAAAKANAVEVNSFIVGHLPVAVERPAAKMTAAP
jgi:hypothetical protein